VLVRCGSRYETRRTNGLSHLLEHMVFRGTPTHPTSYAFNRAIEELGGTLDAATHVDFTSYDLRVPPEHAREAMSPMAEIFRTPTFADLETEKRILREEILEDLDEDGKDIDVDNVARALLFGEHPLGYAIAGSIETVESFTEADLRAHLVRHHGAKNMVLCVAGPVDPEACVEAAAASFGALAPGDRVSGAPPTFAPDAPRFRYVHDTGSQTSVRIEFPTFGLSHPDTMALELLGRVLDDGMASRVQRRIIDELGLAYEAFAATDPYEDAGVFEFGATVTHGKAPELVREMLALARDLRETPIEPEELARVQSRYLFDLRATLDDADSVASFYGVNAVFDLPDTLESTAAEVKAVSAEKLREVACAVLDPREARVACVGVLGPALQKKIRAAMG